MHFNLNLSIAVALCLLPVALALAVIFRKRREQRAARPAPFKELQRRPAGEALRLKLETLDEQLAESMYGLLFFPMTIVFGLFLTRPKDSITPIIFFIASAGSSIFFGIKIYKLTHSRTNCRLGYDGERFVGEELSKLIRVGFEIYHDVPFDGFNIDHVLVGPKGVFIVETKTRSKSMDKTGDKQYQVQFDGKSLRWPWGADRHGIEQAKSNGRTLSSWLSSATGEAVWAVPILTLPGWLVQRELPSDEIYVLNPKEIYKFCASEPEKIPEAQIRRIRHQLDQKCRITIG